MNLKILKTLILFLLLSMVTQSCGIYKKVDARKIPSSGSDRVKKNIEEGKGFRSNKFFGKKKTGEFDFATSNALWRASLDILKFTPLTNVDYSGGVIITDWYAEDFESDKIKISVRFLSNEIRSDGVDVTVFVQKCDQLKNCKISQNDTTLGTEIKLAILKKATLFKNLDDKKNKDEVGDYNMEAREK